MMGIISFLIYTFKYMMIMILCGIKFFSYLLNVKSYKFDTHIKNTVNESAP
jgi:hypothetical protein